MTRIDKVTLAIAAVHCATAAMAAETVAYSYDKADNRTNVTVVSPNSTPPP